LAFFFFLGVSVEASVVFDIESPDGAVASVDGVVVVVDVESVDGAVVVVDPVVVLSVVEGDVDDGGVDGVEGVVCAEAATGTATTASKSIRNLIMI
jgi:hypothetical protein